MEVSRILNLCHVTLTTPTLRGQFVVHWLVHVTFNVCTKYEVSIFNYSQDIRGSHVLALKIWGAYSFIRSKVTEGSQF